MVERIIAFSVHQRWLVLLIVLVASALGAFSLTKVPIDAVPDITNNQVQINARAPSLSANEMEKQVTFAIENAIAGIPGLELTRSLSRSGFAQVTAIFGEKVDLYFARQQVAERLHDAKEDFPPGVEVRMGPVATGLSEIYMWSLRFKDGAAAHASDGDPGFQRDGDYLTPEGELLRTDLQKAAFLRTVQDWIIRPQIRTVPGVASVDLLAATSSSFRSSPIPRSSSPWDFPSAMWRARSSATTSRAAQATSNARAMASSCVAAVGWRRATTSARSC